MVALKPVETVQLQPRCRVDVIHCEPGATAAVKQHQRTPVFLGVSGLDLAEELHRFTWHVIMLHAHGTISVIALIPQLLDVGATEHVAIHEQRPTLVTHQMGHQEAGERKACALLGVARACIEPLGLQLRCDQRGDHQRNAAVLIKAVDQHIGGSPFSRVVADENRDRN